VNSGSHLFLILLWPDSYNRHAHKNNHLHVLCHPLGLSFNLPFLYRFLYKTLTANPGVRAQPKLQ
jgi:hypothetical protein